MEGLDYYLILGVGPEANARTIAEAYRELRSHFPDDPRRLLPQIARRLGLIEEGWRILGSPPRRQLYDRLRSEQAAAARPMAAAVRTVRCQQCGSPVDLAARSCPYCGSARSVEVTPAAGRPGDDVPNYYAVLGVEPQPIPRTPEAGWPAQHVEDWLGSDGDQDPVVEERGRGLLPPSPAEIERAYLERRQELASRPDAELAAKVEVARRVLSDDKRHLQYWALREQLRTREDLERCYQALRLLDREVRAEMRGDTLDGVDGAALLKQGGGYLQLSLPGQAVPVLAAACRALPASAEAHFLYGMALWHSADVASLTPYNVHQLDAALRRAVKLDPGYDSRAAPYLDVARGLLSYHSGQREVAERQFEGAAKRYPAFSAAWRMYAVAALQQGKLDVALNACRQALRLEPDNRAVLVLAFAACRQHPERARDLAAYVAGLRGGKVQPEDVLREADRAIRGGR